MKAWMLVVACGVSFLHGHPALAESGRAEIRSIQSLLKEHGHDPGPIDGVLGGQTRAAIKAYQRARGITPTGDLDAVTRRELGAPDPAATGGDQRPSAVDPAQAAKTGANPSEGASYLRSTEKGLSTSEPAPKR